MEIFGGSFLWSVIWIGGGIIMIILFWVFLRMSNPERTKKMPSLKQDPDKNEKDRLKDRYARGEISKEKYEKELEREEHH